MTLGAEHYSELGPEGIAAIGDGEPLLPGETVTLDWAHPSRDAELLVHADSPLGEWEVVIALSWKPEHVEVTARSDGGLDVRSPGRSDVIAPPTAAPQIDWQPRSARQAAVALLKAADRFQRSLLSIETLCAAIDPVVQPALGVPLSALPVPYHPDVKDPCLVAASFALYGGENSPIPLSTRHHGLCRPGPWEPRRVLDHVHAPLPARGRGAGPADPAYPRACWPGTPAASGGSARSSRSCRSTRSTTAGPPPIASSPVCTGVTGSSAPASEWAGSVRQRARGTPRCRRRRLRPAPPRRSQTGRPTWPGTVPTSRGGSRTTSTWTWWQAA